MFNFTTETVLNDLTKVSSVLGAASTPGSGVPWDQGIELTKVALWIKKLNKFIVGGTFDAIKDATVYKRVATAATLASSKITIPTVVTGTLYRVGVTITTSGYADGMFARDRVLYGKPFYVEIIASATTASVAATALAAAWNNAFASYDHFVTATTNSAELIFTADDNAYIHFKDIVFESIDAVTGLSTLIPLAITVVANGKAAFGDYMHLLKNTRLATLDNYRPFGLNQEELPVVGATYDEYTFKYVAQRGTMAQSVVGGQATSETSHVLWVNTAAPKVTRHITGTSGQSGSYSFDEILEAVGLTILAAEGGSDLTPSAVSEA